MNEIENKTILVTGGANGIGKAIATKFSDNNKVIIIDNDKDGCEELKNQKLDIEIYNEDLTSYENIKKIINEIFEKNNNIDILINNAGIQTVSDIMHLDLKDFENVINVNLTSNFYISQLIANKMKYNGTILNIISTHYNKPRQNKIHYDISKAGVSILTQGFAKALFKRKITVNALAIGATYTKMNKEFEYDEKIVKQTLNKIPLNYICKPTDIANYVYSIIKDFSLYTTGSVFVIDGGRSIKC